jgi:hypothetical protein
VSTRLGIGYVTWEPSYKNATPSGRLILGRRPLVELSGRLLGLRVTAGLGAIRPIAGSGTITPPGAFAGSRAFALRGIAPYARLGRGIAIYGSQRNLQLVEFIPFGIGSLPLWNGKEFLHTATRGNRLLVGHNSIVPPSRLR